MPVSQSVVLSYLLAVAAKKRGFHKLVRLKLELGKEMARLAETRNEVTGQQKTGTTPTIAYKAYSFSAIDLARSFVLFWSRN